MKRFIEQKVTAATVSVNNRVAAAVAALVIQNKHLLLGKRIKNGQFIGWQCPGGYLLEGKSIEESARYYCLHKAGIDISDIQTGPYTNNIFPHKYEPPHTVTLYLIVRKYQLANEALLQDQEICWRWFSIDDLPEPLFLPLKILCEDNDLSRLFQL